MSIIDMIAAFGTGSAAVLSFTMALGARKMPPSRPELAPFHNSILTMVIGLSLFFAWSQAVVLASFVGLR